MTMTAPTPIELGRYLYECQYEGCPEKGARFVVPVSPAIYGWAFVPVVPRHIPCNTEPRLIMINGRSIGDPMTAPEPTTAEEILNKEGDADTPELPITAPPPAYSLVVSIVDNETNSIVGQANSSHMHKVMFDDQKIYGSMLADLGTTAHRRAFGDGG